MIQIELIRNFTNVPGRNFLRGGRALTEADGNTSSYNALSTISENITIKDSADAKRILPYLNDSDPKLRAIAAFSCYRYCKLQRLGLGPEAARGSERERQELLDRIREALEQIEREEKQQQ